MSDLRERFERHQAGLLNIDYEELRDQFDRHEEIFGKRYVTFSDFEKEFELWQACWSHQQTIIDELRSQLNNMEQCYIEKKKECEELRGQIDASKLSQPKLHKTEIGDCLHFSTTMFHDGKATCFDCDAVVNHKREVIGVMQTKALRGES